MKTVMCVAEKPSICNSIANALARGGEMRSSGKSPPVHEFEGSYLGARARYRVTSVLGHVFELDFPEAYRDWDAVDPLELFDAPTIRRPAKGEVVRLLKEVRIFKRIRVSYLIPVHNT
jgi:DNA topoisomerase-3